MQVRCPHCQNALELIDESPLVDIACPSCGSSFGLVRDGTVPYEPKDLKAPAHFVFIERLGAGSFGTVWKARDTKLDRVVAIKIPRKEHVEGDDAELFVREARAAAQLTHPNIVSVHEVGRDGSQLYIVSDFVDGLTLGDWLTAKRSSMREAVEMCAIIAAALHHAHEAGVVHRDLKPSNIMLDADGAPHIMDFGLAKRDAGEITMTIQGKVLGTPAYMSPEQAAGESHTADRRADVYSIGVILFELLTGELPFRGNAKMLMHQVIHDDAPSPCKLNAAVPRDVETICLKCLEKSSARRYATASELADDLQRYLDDKPIQARPPSLAYRTRKFVTRHRTAVISVAAIIVLLIAGTTGTSWGWLAALDAAEREEQAKQSALAAVVRETQAKQSALAAAERETEARETAQQRADELKEVADFQSSMLSQIDATVMGQRILGDARRRIAAKLESDGASPEDIESALTAFNALATHINATDLALRVTDENFLAPAVEVIERDFADQPTVRAALQQTVATIYEAIGLYESAMPVQRAALETRRAELGDDHPHTLTSINNMGYLLQAMGKLAEAERYFREALEVRRRVLGDDHPDTLMSIGNMGYLLEAMGEPAEAEPYFREALEGSRRVLGDDHADTLISINNMGFLLDSMGKPAEAEPYYREALEGSRRVLGDDHPVTLTSINNMGFLLVSLGNLAEAVPYLREALASRRRVQGDDHPDTLTSINNMGGLLDSMGKAAEAEPYYREALEGSRRVLGDDHPNTLKSIYNLGILLLEMENVDDAEPLMLEAYRGWSERERKLTTEEKRLLKNMVKRLIELYEAWDKPEEAGKWREELEGLKGESTEQAGESGADAVTTGGEINP